MIYPETIHATATACQDSRYPNGLAAVASGHDDGPELFDLRAELAECWNMAGDDDLPALAELAEHFGLDAFMVPHPSGIRTMEQLADAYADAIDQSTEDVVIAGMTFLPSRVLREVDPTAFRCGMLDYADAHGIDTDDLAA